MRTVVQMKMRRPILPSAFCRRMWKWVVFTILLTCGGNTKGQIASYWGTDFWVGFLCNWHDSDQDRYTFCVVGPRTCTVTISNPHSGWSQTLNLTGGQSATYTSPASSATQFYQAGSCVTTNKGIHVVSTDTVMLYVFNSSGTPNSCDATSVLPTSSLGSRYLVQTYPVYSAVSDYYSCFNVVGVEDNTDVIIVLSCATSTGYSAGDTISVTLNAGQVYQVKSPEYVGDFSGTYIYSVDCKPFAVFSGATLARIPNTAVSGDHILLQSMPMQMWGQSWILCPAFDNNRTNRYRITTFESNCAIYRNGSLLTTLGARESYEINSASGMRIQTSKPVEVSGFTQSRNSSSGGERGDVSGFPVPPIEQFIKNARFVTFTVHNRPSYSAFYHVSAIVPSSETTLLQLDGVQVSATHSFHQIGTDYSYVTCSIADGYHTLSTTGSGFIAQAYGSGEDWEAYSMNLGCNAEVIYDISYDTIDTVYCGELFSYHGQEYSSSGYYMTGDSCIGFTILHLTLLAMNQDTIDTVVCGNHFVWFDSTLYSSGHYTHIIGNNNGDCGLEIHLNLELHPTYEVWVDTSTCTGSLVWDGQSLTDDTNRMQYTTAHGCDSIVYVLLAKNDTYQVSADTVVCGDSCSYHDTVLVSEGIHRIVLESVVGCDSVVDLNLTFRPIYYSTLDTASCTGIIVWEDSVIDGNGEYVYRTVDGCDSVLGITVDLLPSFDTLYYVCITDTESYTWINGITYTHTIDTAIYLRNQFGCDSILRLMLEVEPVFKEPLLWIPNVFTPDQPINSTFTISSRHVSRLTVSIFHRWGDRICTFDGLTQSWDGTYRGRDCQQGTYVYLIEYYDLLGIKMPSRFGAVTLLRGTP